MNEYWSWTGNSLMCAGRTLPWLQDTTTDAVWTRWGVTNRDLQILDRGNAKVETINLTDYGLQWDANYAYVKWRLKQIAGEAFAARADHAAGHASALAAGDLNGDGLPDIAAANAGDDTVSVFIGGVRADLASGHGPSSVAIADVNSDSKLDLVATNRGDGTVSIFLGHGDGTFAPPATFACGADPVAVAAGDLNGDGRPDLVVVNASASAVSVLLGDGSGSFGAPASFATGAGPAALALADLDGDGKLDIVTANATAGSVSVLRGGGDGTFLGRADAPVGQGPVALSVEDLDGDGKLDVATSPADGTIVVLFGDGSGAFPARNVFDMATTGAARAVAIADLDGDGRPDVVVADGAGFSCFSGLGNRFFKRADVASPGQTIAALVVADLDGNGKRDVVVADPSATTVSVFLAR